MKRINLSVDFEDNELFEKSLRDTVKAEIKTLMRNGYGDNLENIVKEKCDRLIPEKVPGYTVREIADKKIQSRVRDLVDDLDIDVVISSKIDKILDAKIEYALANIDDKINGIIKEVITNKVIENLNNVLSK